MALLPSHGGHTGDPEVQLCGSFLTLPGELLIILSPIWWMLTRFFSNSSLLWRVTFRVKPHAVFVVYNSCGLFLGPALLAWSVLSPWSCQPSRVYLLSWGAGLVHDQVGRQPCCPMVRANKTQSWLRAGRGPQPVCRTHSCEGGWVNPYFCLALLLCPRLSRADVRLRLSLFSSVLTDDATGLWVPNLFLELLSCILPGVHIPAYWVL